MAPFFLWPVLWVTLPALLIAMEVAAGQTGERVARLAPWQRSPLGRMADVGWWFGFGYHVFGLFWIGEAFLVEADTFAWLLPFAVTLLPAGLALFTAAATAFAGWVARPGFMRVVALALGFGVTEWLRGHVFTGFPWNVLGYALTYPLVLLQSVSVLGIYGLTLLVVLVFAGPYTLWSQNRWHAAALAVGPIMLLAAFGWWRLEGAGDSDASALLGQPKLRIVQPSVLQREKWQPEHQRRIFDDHLVLSATTAAGAMDGVGGLSLIVWPEAAMPFLPLEQPIALQEIGRMLPDGATLLSGGLRAEIPDRAGDKRRVYNSLLALGASDDQAILIAKYDKTHLVPFGEYLPLQTLLEAVGLQQLSRLRGGFTPGPEPRALIDVAGVGKLAPLICYEAVFPGRIVQTVERPRAIVNVTNDGWFGNTTGPRQHFHKARVRAVEEGLPVIRAANNGISAVISGHGVVVKQLGMNFRGALDARLPPALAPTTYARWGDWMFVIGSIGLMVGLMISHARGRRDVFL